MQRLYLLEPDFRVVIQNWDEWCRLLNRALRNVEEVRLILMRQELLRCERILFEEISNERGWLVEAAIRLQFGGLGPTAIHAGEALFDTAQPISREVA
jgi:hypothetical protein